MNSLWSNYNENVKSKPDKVIFKEATSGKEIKFKELEIESEKVADYIEANSTKFGKYVGVSSSKKINSVVTMIGVMKTGRAYIPIDDHMPPERKAYILSQCDNSYCSYDEAMSVDVPHVERNIEAIGMDESAYIIYTSGSTGIPKGVEISYSSVINTVLSVNDNFSVDSNDVIINLAPFDFDLSVYDIINALMIGSKLVITQDGRDIELIREMLINEKITVWNSVPMVMEMLITYLQFKYPNEEIPSMKNIFLSGDKTYVKLAHKMKKVFPNTEVVSMGGATECAVWSNYFKFSELVTEEEIIPYGYALDNQTFMVSDIVQYDMGLGVFMDLDDMRDIFDQDKSYYNVLYSNKELNIERGRLYTITTKEDIEKMIDNFCGSLGAVVYMITFGAILVYVVVTFLMIKLMIDRASLNISMMKIFGLNKKEIKKLYLDCNFITIVISSIISVPVAKVFVDKFWFPIMNMEIGYGFNVEYDALLYVLIYLSIFVLYFTISTLLRRRINSVPMVEVLKNRE